MTPPVRRFEPEACVMAACDFLKARGYKFRGFASKCIRVILPSGERRNIHRAELVALLDAERVKLGLEPIRLPRPAPAAVPRKRITAGLRRWLKERRA